MSCHQVQFIDWDNILRVAQIDATRVYASNKEENNQSGALLFQPWHRISEQKAGFC
jgi:hypothetical protein